MTSENSSSTRHSSMASAATTCWADVERVGRHRHLLDGTGPHPLDRHGRLREVAAVLRETAPLGSPRRPGGRRGRRAGARWRRWAATRSGRRGRPSPCRCRALRLLVATTQGRRPRLRSSSMIARCSLDTDPAGLGDDGLGAAALAGLRHHLGGRLAALRWSRRPPRRDPGPAPPVAARSAAISLRRAVSRSASRRELAKTIVERCRRRGRRAPPRAARCSSIGRGRRTPRRTPRARRCPRRARRRAGPTPWCWAGRRSRRAGCRRGSGRPRRGADGRAEPDALGRAVEQVVEALEADAEAGAAWCRRPRAPRR